MNIIAAPAPSSPYATEAEPNLQRHHWQGLASLVADHRPEWPVAEIIENLWMVRDRKSYAELASIALTVAMNERYKTPAAIHFAAVGMISL